MKYEVWKSDGCYTFFQEDNISMREAVLHEPNPSLVHTIEAENWDQAMTKYHEFMGWEPYKPMIEDYSGID